MIEYEVYLNEKKGIQSPGNLWKRISESRLELVAFEGNRSVNNKSLEVYQTPDKDLVIMRIYWKKAQIALSENNEERARKYLIDNIKGLSLKEVQQTDRHGR